MALAAQSKTEELLQNLKKLDPEKHLSCLYLPEDVRPAAVSIYLFDAEIRRIPELISEPLPGEIRLQFWRDAIAKNTVGDAGPIGAALLQTIADYHLPKEVFHNYLNARIFDLYNDPMPDMGTYEGYLGETDAALVHMIALCAGADRSTELADACGHAGMAIGTARLLANMCTHWANQRRYLPEELLSNENIQPSQWFSEVTPAHTQVVRQMVKLGSQHRENAEAALRSLDRQLWSVFLPLAFVRPTFKKIERLQDRIFSEPVHLNPVVRQWSAFRWAATH